MSLWKMFKEEWRMHCRIYSGNSFAAFPVLVFLLTAGFSFMIQRYSTVGANSVALSLPLFGIFLGLAVGSVGFSSRDALKNLLGRTNYILYSSRTLPVSSNKLLAEFIIKDIIYYGLFFLTPLVAGVFVVSGFRLSALYIIPAFLLGLLISVLAAQTSLKLPKLLKPSYTEGRPLTEKSMLDLERSSGGILKILFSLMILSGFYWFLVLKFPFADVFLNQPMISFAVLLGTISVTVYNWLNRFDSADDYLHLPVDRSDLLKAKQKAFVRITFPIITVFTVLPIFVYGGNLFVSVITALSACTFALGASSTVFGLEPNTRIYSSVHFTKLILLNSTAVVPLLLASVFGIDILYMILLDGLAAVSGVYLIKKAHERI